MIFVNEDNEIKIGKDDSFNKEKGSIILQGHGNKLIIGDNFKIAGQLAILIEGNNNKVFIGNNFKSNGHLIMVINGNNNNINLGNNIEITNHLNITLNDNSENCCVNVGDSAILCKTNFNVNGKDNKLLIGNNLENKGDFAVSMTGDNNKTKFGNDIEIVAHAFFNMGIKSKNRYIEVGDFTSFYKTDVQNYDQDSSLIIGKDCMFSYDTTINNNDGHAIFQNGKLINQAKTCKIGDHVWVGWSAVIMKNCVIPNGTIIARNALVCKRFKKQNTIIAGIPAKIVKENIEWSRLHVNDVLRQQEEKNII